MRHVYVVVHAAAEHHDADLVGGWYDSALSPLGHEQAAQVAGAIRALVPEGAPCPVHSSDLRRAVQTAGAIAAVLGSEVRTDPGLRELSYGVAEGRPSAWLDERYTAAPDHDRLDHDGGVEGAETKRQLATRVQDAVARVLAVDAEHQVVVTHGFALTFVVTAWARIPVDHVGWIDLRAPAASITHLVEDDRFRNRGVRSLAATGHLVP